MRAAGTSPTPAEVEVGKPRRLTFLAKPAIDAHLTAIDGALADMPIMAYAVLP
jgi:hypothetical protein